MHDRANRVAYLECERHLGGPGGCLDRDPLLQQERGADSGLLSLCTLVAPSPDRPAKLGNIAHHEKKSDCLVVMGRRHDTRRNELDWRR